MNDTRQVTLFPKTEQELGQEREEAFFEKIISNLREVVQASNANPEDISYNICTTYTSLNFRSSNICRVKLRGKKWHISIPKSLKEVIPIFAKTEIVSSESQFIRISFDSLPEDEIISLIKEATLLSIEKVPKEFDCCSRFEACNNAKVCVHPDPAFSLLCGYRKILKSGRFFSGENRNID